MNHEQLSAYLDGELSPQEAQAVRDWLAANPRGQRELDGLKRLQTILGKLPGYAGTAAMKPRFFARLASEKRAASWSAVGAVTRWAVAACVVLALGTAAYVSTQPAAPVGPVGPAAAPAVAANPALRTPPPAANGEAPSDEMLMALDLLSSDVNLAAVASLDEQELKILQDGTYFSVLENYDVR